MGSVFHQLCPRYSGTLTPIAPTANRLWKTFTCTSVTYVGSNPAVNIININKDRMSYKEKYPNAILRPPDNKT